MVILLKYYELLKIEGGGRDMGQRCIEGNGHASAGRHEAEPEPMFCSKSNENGQ